MKTKTELRLTVVVVAVGAIYFLWKAITTEGSGQLTYIAFIIVGGIFGHRAITDVLAKQRAENRKETEGDLNSG